VAGGLAVDIQEIDGASHRKAEEMGEIREAARYLPARLARKVYIIDEVHMLSDHAFNALLKTLEEPPPRVVFILATTAPEKVPATIHSRCQRFDLRRLPQELIASEIARIALGEGVALDDDAARLVAREADGSMRDALSLLERVITWASQEEGEGQ
jgi:DNA polymerase-3 subunit gamma/tau